MFIDRNAPGTARISVAVTEFREIGRGPCRADVALTDTGNGSVSQAGVNDTIVVYADVYLDFQVSGAREDRNSYMPIGIAFQACATNRAQPQAENNAAGTGGRDPLGRAAFPLRATVSKRDGAQLTVFDANPEPNEFKFSLVVQRSDGALGIIDPPVKNNGGNMNK